MHFPLNHPIFPRPICRRQEEKDTAESNHQAGHESAARGGTEQHQLVICMSNDSHCAGMLVSA